MRLYWLLLGLPLLAVCVYGVYAAFRDSVFPWWGKRRRAQSKLERAANTAALKEMADKHGSE